MASDPNSDVAAKLISVSSLATDEAWEALHTTIDPKKDKLAVVNVIRHLKELDAQSTIVEETYLDADFTDSFSNFYATVFKRHTKLCRRFHFFSTDVKPIFNEKNPSDITQKLQNAGVEDGYLGFIIVRPVQHAPLEKVVLRLPPNPANMESHLLVRADYKAHLLGATFSICGIPLTQQDQRIGACAQASVWMSGRHFHVKHSGPWVSTVAITDAATAVVDENLSRSLPAGSEFLSPSNMIQALRSMGRKPILYSGLAVNSGRLIAQWPNMRPQDIIYRYVDSGIPVILGLTPLPNDPVGHAVVATGHTLKEISGTDPLPHQPTRAGFCECFLINDDQRGVNLRLPLSSSSTVGETQHSVAGNVGTIIIPLPNKVFIPGEKAEKYAWNLLDDYRKNWVDHKTYHKGSLGLSESLGDEFVDEIQKNEVIARTYLTYGWKYKVRMMRNIVGEDYKSILLYQELPRFVWITEFGTRKSLNYLGNESRRIFSHAVIDATASDHWECRSMFHAPGFGKRWFHNDMEPFGDYKDAVTPVLDDQPYCPKVRGIDDYAVHKT